MQSAIEQALRCEIDVPVGCVIKKDGQIIAAAHNRRELDLSLIHISEPTRH